MMTEVRKPKPSNPYDVIRWAVADIDVSIPNVWCVKAWVRTLAAPIPAEELPRLESVFHSRFVWACRQRENRVRYAHALVSALESGLTVIRDQMASANSVAA